MAIELRRDLDPTIRARLENLDRVDHAGAQALADRYNSGALDATGFDREITSSLASYRGITASNQGGAFNASAARFGKVIPLRTETVSAEAGTAIDMTAGLAGISGPAALDARPGIIRSITAAIS